MKLKVLKSFYDKDTNELYEVGSVIDVSESRANEILASKFEVAELVEEKSVIIKTDEQPKKTRSKKRQ
jgi:hypothetical protein